MKKIFLILSLVTPIFFSCSNDDDSVSNPVNDAIVVDNQKMLLGTWEVQSVNDEYLVNGEIVENEEENFNDGLLGSLFEFKSGNEITLTIIEDSENTDVLNGMYIFNEEKKLIDLFIGRKGRLDSNEKMHEISLTENEFKFSFVNEDIDDDGTVHVYRSNFVSVRKN